MQPRSRATPAGADVAPVTSVSRVKTDFALERQEKALGNDAKYKKYKNHVEKTLGSFESVAEWADFITFLAKLLKTLQTYPQFTVIPHKLNVAKRLAQCLNPALPTGVHQRALDVYVHILNTIGPENLCRDLAAWSSGLFPFFQYAATSVRPIVLGIYTKFYLPLQESLRPCIKAFILALLPGVEEETSEFFDKVSSLLDQLSGTVSPPFFFQHLWLILMTCPSSRVAALNYLSKRLPTISPQDRIAPIIGDDPGLMVRGFAAALDEGQVLVQRGVLDLLCSTLHLDGRGFKSEVRPDDQVLLMRSALSIVLRRDLSLTRRLYSWLLGKSDSSATQMDYFKTNALAVVTRTMKADWARVSDSSSTSDDSGVERQKPFKIFVSLLDRWEIGAVLTSHLVLDLFAALEQSMKMSDQNNEELLVTASILFEGLDPYLTWQQFYLAAKDQLTDSKTTLDRFQLISFVCHTFRFHDAELQRLHVPLLAFGLLDFISDTIHKPSRSLQQTKLTEALHLLHELLEEIPPFFYGPADSQDQTVSFGEHGGVGKRIASDFYSASNIAEARLPDASMGPILHASGLDALLRATQSFVEALVSRQEGLSESDLALTSALMDVIAQLVSARSDLTLSWNPSSWLSAVSSTIDQMSGSQAGFDCLAASLHTLVALHHSAAQPVIDIDTQHIMTAFLNKLFFFLGSSFAPVHVEAVQLVWTLHSLTKFNYVETIISQQLSSPDESIQMAAFNAFGNLWRLTDDEHLPARALVAPLFLVLDATKSDNLATRAAAEAWMRCHFKSYLRMVDPIVLIITDPSIQRTPVQLTSGPCTVQLFQYTEPFDSNRTHYALSLLQTLFLTRGAAFMRTVRSTSLKQSTDPDVRLRGDSADGANSTYLEAITSTLLNFLLTDQPYEDSHVPKADDLQLHSLAMDLLQIVLQRTELDVLLRNRIRNAFLVRLLSSIQRSQPLLQNKLLHALHATFTAKVVATKIDARPSSNHQSLQDPDDFEDVNGQLLRHVLLQAISTQKDGAVIHQWVDFLFLSVSYFQASLDTLVFPLVIATVHRLQSLVNELQECFDPRRKGKNIATGANDLDFAAFVGLLERLMVFALEDRKHEHMPSSSPKPEKPSSSETGTGFLTYMSGVLGSPDPLALKPSDELSSAPIIVHLNHAVAVLTTAYAVSKNYQQEQPSSSQTYVLDKVNVRVYRTLERLYKAQPAECVEALIVRWTLAESSHAKHVFQLLQALAPSSQNVVATCCDRISMRSPFRGEKSRSLFLNHELADTDLFCFLEAFLSALDSPVAISAWGSLGSFIRDTVLNASPQVNFFLMPSLQCIVTIAEKMAQTPALEDRRLRRELHDLFQRTLDATLTLIGKASDQIKRMRSSSTLKTGASTMPSSIVANGVGTEKDLSDAPAPPMNSEGATWVAPKPNGTTGVLDLCVYLAHHVLPRLRDFQIEHDRIALICTSIMQSCIAPAFNKKTRTFEVEPPVFTLLAALVTIQPAQRAWKPAVAEWFQDNRLFHSSPDAASLWKPIVQQLIGSDKERCLDLIGRISTTTSANIFANRELEAVSKATSVRRLTFAIWSSDKNKHLAQLPAIQEKLVDVLRASVGDLVHAEAYLCLRVLLCRISQEHLTSFWPIVLTEMLRTFESQMENSVETPESLGLTLAASKFLDLLLVLQAQDFQVHEWMFVTDTIDAVYPPDDWTPHAIVDRLSIVMSDRLTSISAKDGNQLEDVAISIDPQIHPTRMDTHLAHRRRPLLAQVRQKTKLKSLVALEPFFGRISLYSFESAYRLGSVDWHSVSSSIESDIFEG